MISILVEEYKTCVVLGNNEVSDFVTAMHTGSLRMIVRGKSSHSVHKEKR